MKRERPSDDFLDAADRIDERCDAFESAWRNGERPGIAEFIDFEGESLRNQLFRELLLVDVEWRSSSGEKPTADDYRERFPEFASQVDTVSVLHGATVFSDVPAKTDAVRDGILQPGARVAHFQLVEHLGSGAMGGAWKAWDTRVKRYVAIKLPHGRSLSESALRRFLREAEAVAQLSHPQLASIHSIENDGHGWFIVTAYVEGQNLQSYAKGKPLESDEAARICGSIALALQHAHDQGIVHRDLKPANIIIDANALPHIIDFGLAKIANGEGNLTLNGEVLGTPAYMSPELASGDAANADARTDVYSLGVILYELLTGARPFEGNRGSVMRQILTNDPPRPRSFPTAIPRDLETICLRAMEKEPANRYVTVAAMADDLNRFAQGQPILARRAGVLEKGRRWISRHPAWAALAVFVLFASLLASTTIASLHKRSKWLEGYRPVRITTTPSGARIALVPLDPMTNEPDTNETGVIRPTGTTPLMTELKAGTYLVEAVLPGDESRGFAEVYRTVLDSSQVHEGLERKNTESGLDPKTCRFHDINIASPRETIDKMVKVQIPAELRKQNPILPQVIYVDDKQTTPSELLQDPEFKGLLRVAGDGNPNIGYASAIKWAERNQARIAASAEYDAIVAAVKMGGATSMATGKVVTMDDLFDDLPEFSTTIKRSSGINGNGMARLAGGMHVLKGFDRSTNHAPPFPWADGEALAGSDSDSPKISVRGVRSATPRFVKP